MLKIKLTKKQKKALAPIFKKMEKAAQRGKPGIILGQVFSDTVKVKFLIEKTSKRVQKAVGNKTDKTISHLQ